MSRKIDTIGGNHVKRRMGYVDDSGNTENKRKPDSQQCIGAAVDQGGDKDVQYHGSSQVGQRSGFRVCGFRVWGYALRASTPHARFKGLELSAAR